MDHVICQVYSLCISLLHTLYNPLVNPHRALQTGTREAGLLFALGSKNIYHFVILCKVFLFLALSSPTYSTSPTVKPKFLNSTSFSILYPLVVVGYHSLTKQNIFIECTNYASMKEPILENSSFLFNF